jgi:hypothetical protein
MPGGPLLGKDNQVSGGRERLVVVHYRELTGGQLRELKAFDPKCRVVNSYWVKPTGGSGTKVPSSDRPVEFGQDFVGEIYG